MKPPTTVDPDDTNMRTRKPNPWYRWLIHHAIAPWWAVAGWRMVKIWNMLGDGEMRPGVIKSGWDELRYSLEFGGGYGFFSNMCRKKMVCMHFLSKTLISRTNRFAYSDGVPGSRCFFNFQFIYHYEGKQWQNHGACQNRRAWLAQCQFEAKSLSFTCVVWKCLELCSPMFYFEIYTVISAATHGHVTCGGSGRSSFGMSSALCLNSLSFTQAYTFWKGEMQTLQLHFTISFVYTHSLLRV